MKINIVEALFLWYSLQNAILQISLKVTHVCTYKVRLCVTFKLYKMKKQKTNISYTRCCVYIFALCLCFGKTYAQAPVTTVIGNTSGPGSWFYGPIMRNTGNSGLLNYSRHAYIYTSSEIPIPVGAKIIKLEWLKKDGPSITGSNHFNLWLKNTTSATFNSTELWTDLIFGATQVSTNTSFSISSGTNVWINSTQPVDSFTYDGNNLQILTDWAKLGSVVGSTGVNFYTLSATGKAIGIASSAVFNSATTLQSATYGNSRPTIRITYVPVPACSGTPTIDSVTTTTAQPCSGNDFILTANTTVSGAGITFLWERAEDALFTQNVSQIGSSPTLTLSQTGSSYYRCTATCSASGLSDAKSIYLPIAPLYQCYCASGAISPADEDIYNVTFSTMTNASTCGTLAPGLGSSSSMYSNYQTSVTPPAIERLSLVPFSVQVGTCLNNFYANNISLFIDYNQDGDFLDTGELVYTSPNAHTGAHTEYGSITVPATALLGYTGLRVIVVEANNPITNPCVLYNWGETEDYVINITATTNCSGPPAPGNTVSSIGASVCTGNIAVLTLQNLTTGQGVSYQWYKNAVAISGATSINYTTIPLVGTESYYCAVTCSYSGITTNTTPIVFSLKNFKECYCNCQPSSNVDDDIFSVTLNGATNAYDCVTPAPGTGSILNRYSNFFTLGNLTSIALGGTVNFSVLTDECDVPPGPYSSCAMAIWIDLNQNGSYADAGEKLFVETSAQNGPRTITGTITIPCTALSGQTGLRIALVQGLSGSQLQPCLNYGFGETEDYLVNLTGVSCALGINLTLFLEGYMNGPNTMTSVLMNQGVGANPLVSDSITVELRNTTGSYNLVASQKVVLSTSGVASPSFSGVPAGTYYIVIKHRNVVETWSALPVALSNGSSYNFSTGASQAYGSNQVQISPSVWAMYSGDLNFDDNVDLTDFVPVEIDINNFASGYLSTDLNGDGNVDLLDNAIIETNVAGFVFSNHP